MSRTSDPNLFFVFLTTAKPTKNFVLIIVSIVDKYFEHSDLNDGFGMLTNHFNCYFLFHDLPLSCLSSRTPPNELYTLSYLWYSATAVAACIILGLVVSFITGMHKHRIRQNCPYSLIELFKGELQRLSGRGAVAQSVERATPGEEVPGSISAVAARSLLLWSVSV